MTLAHLPILHSKRSWAPGWPADQMKSDPALKTGWPPINDCTGLTSEWLPEFFREFTSRAGTNALPYGSSTPKTNSNLYNIYQYPSRYSSSYTSSSRKRKALQTNVTLLYTEVDNHLKPHLLHTLDREYKQMISLFKAMCIINTHHDYFCTDKAINK